MWARCALSELGAALPLTANSVTHTQNRCEEKTGSESSSSAHSIPRSYREEKRSRAGQVCLIPETSRRGGFFAQQAFSILLASLSCPAMLNPSLPVSLAEDICLPCSQEKVRVGMASPHWLKQ